MNVTQDKGLIAAKTRLTNIQADIAEIKRKALEGIYIPKTEADKLIQTLIIRVKSRLLALPGRIAAETAGKNLSHAEIVSAVDKLVKEILSELAGEVPLTGEDKPQVKAER